MSVSRSSLSLARVRARYLQCLEEKVLQFFPSDQVLVNVSHDRAPVVLRSCPTLIERRNAAATNKTPSATTSSEPKKADFNPFLPYERELLLTTRFTSQGPDAVVDCDDDNHSDYALIFNKFCIIPEHLLIITTKFVDQHAPLTVADFAATQHVLSSLSEAKPLAFYNSNAIAGASQRHRHFQVIHSLAQCPIESFMCEVTQFNVPTTVPVFESMTHLCYRRSSSATAACSTAETENWHWTAFQAMKAHESLSTCPFEAFNLLWTSEWMLLVPRRAEHAVFRRTLAHDESTKEITTVDCVDSVNAMAFAGHLLVMCDVQNVDAMRSFDVIRYLQQVTFPQRDEKVGDSS